MYLVLQGLAQGLAQSGTLPLYPLNPLWPAFPAPSTQVSRAHIPHCSHRLWGQTNPIYNRVLPLAMCVTFSQSPSFPGPELSHLRRRTDKHSSHRSLERIPYSDAPSIGPVGCVCVCACVRVLSSPSCPILCDPLVL